MKKFEYKIEEWSYGTGIRRQEWLNNYGSQGWEVVDIETTNTGAVYTFKREIEPEYEYEIVRQALDVKGQIRRREASDWKLFAVVPGSMPLLTGVDMSMHNNLVFRREKK